MKRQFPGEHQCAVPCCAVPSWGLHRARKVWCGVVCAVPALHCCLSSSWGAASRNASPRTGS
jgi:hypothetical protein